MNRTWQYALVCTSVTLALVFATRPVAASTPPPANLQVLHSFCRAGTGTGCSDASLALGYSPQDIVAGPDDAYYGTTLYGNPTDASASVYRADPVTRKLSVFYQFPKDFHPARWLKVGPDGALYGGYIHDPNNVWQSEGIFRLSPEGVFSIIYDAKIYEFSCNAPVQDSLGNWIGVTSGYPGPNQDFVYKLTPGGGFKILHTLSNGEEFGCGEYEPVLAADGNLYGVYGAIPSESSSGAIYRFAPDETFTVVHTFDRDSDGYPATPLTLGSDGALYGITHRDLETPQVNTMFRMSLDGQFTNLSSGFGPPYFWKFQKLTLMPDGYFYGTALDKNPGGEYNVLFRLSAAGEYNQLYETDLDYYSIISPLIRGFDNALYGADSAGGKYGEGTLFRYVPPPVQ